MMNNLTENAQCGVGFKFFDQFRAIHVGDFDPSTLTRISNPFYAVLDQSIFDAFANQL